MGNFDEAYEQVLKNEGGYSNQPNDRGGETYSGISRRFYPDWGGWTRIDAARSEAGFPDNLTQDGYLSRSVKSFYKKYYWDKILGDELPHAIALKLFDTAVNLGLRRSIRLFQEALNLLNRNKKNYDDLTVDGLIGSKTVEAMQILLKQDETEEHLLNLMRVLQGEHYVGLMRMDESQEVFARGWVRRVLYS